MRPELGETLYEQFREPKARPTPTVQERVRETERMPDEIVENGAKPDEVIAEGSQAQEENQKVTQSVDTEGSQEATEIRGGVSDVATGVSE